MPIFDLFFLVVSFFREKFSLLISAPISLKKSNRAKVGVIVQKLKSNRAKVDFWPHF